MKRYELAIEQGRLCIVEQSTDSRTPQIIRSYWPTNRGASDFTSDDLANAQLWDRMDSDYSLAVKWPGCGYWSNVQLMNGGATKPIRTELVELPAPKQRGKACELRYYDGRWEKRTAARGWVAA